MVTWATLMINAENILQMVTCCEHVNCIYWSGFRRLVWTNGDWAKEAAFAAQALLLAPCLYHFPILTSGLRLRGTGPRDWWFPLELELHVPRRDSQPQHTLAQALQPSSSPPPNCCQSPWEGFLQSVVLSVPFCCSNPKEIVFPIP